MTNTGITILKNIDNINKNAYNTVVKTANNASGNASFDDALNAAQKATAALAVDVLVASNEDQGVNTNTVQTFFRENNITISLTPVNTNTNTSSNTTNDNPVTTKADASNVKSSSQSASNVPSNSSILKCSDELEQYFNEAAEKYNVDIKLLKSIAKQESNFNSKATSRSGAMGIMQLMPATAKQLGVTNAYDPKANIMGGAKLISQLLDKYDNNKTLALAAYNAGSGNVAKYGGVPPFKETQNYIKKVLGYYNS